MSNKRKASKTIRVKEESDTGDIVTIYDKEEVYTCLEHLKLKLVEKYTQKQLAEHFGISTVAIWKRINKWKRTGVYDYVMDMLMLPVQANIDDATLAVLNEWPQVINLALDEALHGKTAQVRHKARVWLNTEIVKPQMDKRKDPDHDEMVFLSAEHTFAPTLIPLLDDPNSPAELAEFDSEEEAS